MLSCYVPGKVKLSHQSIILLWGIRIIRVSVATQLVISLIGCCPCLHLIKMHATTFCENPGHGCDVIKQNESELANIVF